jgi:hypothetical protein
MAENYRKKIGGFHGESCCFQTAVAAAVAAAVAIAVAEVVG